MTATLYQLRLKDRVAVKTAGRFATRQTAGGASEMRIGSAQRSDAGLYVCKIVNEYGTKQAECRVEVKGERRRGESVRLDRAVANILTYSRVAVL